MLPWCTITPVFAIDNTGVGVNVWNFVFSLFFSFLNGPFAVTCSSGFIDPIRQMCEMKKKDGKGLCLILGEAVRRFL